MLMYALVPVLLIMPMGVAAAASRDANYAIRLGSRDRPLSPCGPAPPVFSSLRCTDEAATRIGDP